MNTDKARPSVFDNLTIFESFISPDTLTDGMSDLPREIALMTFSFFGLRELSMASLTCKTWRVYAVNELVARGKNKWRLVDSLISEGWVNRAFKVADTLPYCDPLYVSLFNRADMKNDFPLSLKIASYKDYNPRLIGQLAHCFSRDEKTNWKVLIEWIQGLNVNNQSIFLTARHLIGLTGRNLAQSGRNDLIKPLIVAATQKDIRLTDSLELKSIGKILFDQGNFVGLLDFGLCTSGLDNSTPPLVAVWLSNAPGLNDQLEHWIKQVDSDPLDVAKLMMSFVNCLCFMNKQKEMTLLVDLICKLKLQDRADNPIGKIKNELFWEIVGRSIHHEFIAKAFTDKLNHLQAWEEGKNVVAFSVISLIHKEILIERIEIAQAIRLSELEDEAANQQERIKSYYQDIQNRKKIPVQEEYIDDEEEFMAYLNQSEVIT